MSQPITTRDLTNATHRWYDAAKDAGLVRDDQRAILDHGSRTYGRAFRLWLQTEPNTGYSSAPGTPNGYLGTTRREAYAALDFMTRTLWALKEGS